MKKYEVLFLAWLIWLPDSLSGQDPAIGVRVRVSTSTMRASTGLLLATTRDSLLVGFSNRSAAPVALARNDLESFQMSLGGDGKHGAIVGAQMGMAAGAIGFGIEHLRSRQPPPRFHYDNGDLAVAALTGAAWGLVAGGLAGAVIAQERWASAPVPPATNEALPAYDARTALQTQVRLGLFTEGDAIRLRTREGHHLQGRYDGYANGEVRIVGDSSYLIPLSNIVGIFERRPMTGPWLRRGTWIGAVLGVGTVAAVALSDDDDCDPNFCMSPWGFSVAFGVYGALTGATVGAILGSYAKGWRAQQW